jgi:hypothetical protein
MHLGLREIAAAFSATALIFCCSCEEHHIGEDPEVQKEHTEAAAGGEETTAESKAALESPTPSASSTPVEFFPETSPTP